MRANPAETAKALKLPQFFIEVKPSMFVESDYELLNQELLLKGFKLSQEDTKIDFEQISTELFKVDIQEVKKDEYTPTFTRIEHQQAKDPLIEYVLAKPKEGQISDIAHRIVQLIGNMYPIPDQEIKSYVRRILDSLNSEQLRDILLRSLSYSAKIKEKVRSHADKYAGDQFDKLIFTGKIKTMPHWQFPQFITGKTGPSIGNALYEAEGDMNTFEAKAITDIASMDNIAFWHRNLGRGKGFAINGFKSNHYPDFILATKSGKVLILETKGDDRDNPDSAAKRKLGKTWAEKAGEQFIYMMVYDKQQVQDAFTLDEARELIRDL